MQLNRKKDTKPFHYFIQIQLNDNLFGIHFNFTFYKFFRFSIKIIMPEIMDITKSDRY